MVSSNPDDQLTTHFQTNDYELNLTDSGRNIENIIRLYTPESNYNAISANTGRKIEVKALALIINEDTVKADKISTRGKTTLYYRRKSLSLDLKAKALFRHGEKTESFKKFFLLSLSMDRNYSNNRLAFEMMEISNLFHLFYSYCELIINDKNEGIYMVIERPEDWAIKKKDSPLVIRRGYNEEIDKIVNGKEINKSQSKEYCSNYNQIYKCLYKYEGVELYKALSSWLDIEFYMKWLAFNFFIRNGDYTDEVYFYFDPAISKFRIIPWDYDDIFHLAPHEGNTETGRNTEEKFIFSAEDLLDEKIAEDPYLYKIYLAQFREVLNQLSPAVMKKVFETTYAELYPYYKNEAIIRMSAYDAHKNVNIESLQNDMFAMYAQLKISREIHLNNLNNKLLP
jgi:spore coat protein H